MSMSGFFIAFTQDEIDAMTENHSLIDEWIFEDEKFAFSTDVDNAWYVLSEVLDGDGFHVGEHVENALSMGCFLVSAEDTQNQVENLSRWTHDEILENLRNLDEDADLYRLDRYKENEEMLLNEFDKLVAFYKQAAAKNLGVVHYIA
jgi:hypothetical protein